MPKQRIDFEVELSLFTNFPNYSFQITNHLNQKLKCSLFTPTSLKQKVTKYPYNLHNQIPQFPCVIYCHGNSASRVEALEIVDLLLPNDIIVAALDFSGYSLEPLPYFQTK